MTVWTPIPIPPAPPYSDASSGRILLESGFPNFLLQEGGFPPIGILLEGSAITTTWTPVNTNP
jgi:hypothetical protein